jgi:hypothetical protein
MESGLIAIYFIATVGSGRQFFVAFPLERPLREALQSVSIDNDWEMAVAFVFETLPAQRNVIALDDPREVSWWSKQFGCSEEQLLEAVAEVGPSAAQVEQLLDGMEIVTV